MFDKAFYRDGIIPKITLEEVVVGKMAKSKTTIPLSESHPELAQEWDYEKNRPLTMDKFMVSLRPL